MEKVSHIVPASTRQIWSSGENDKPRRITEPNPEEGARGGIQSSGSRDFIPAPTAKQEQPVVMRDPTRGNHLNTTA